MSSTSQEAEQETDEEITFESSLADLVDNEALSDVALKGSDGAIVYANRCILAARSKVFRAMLYGDFSESGQAEIKLDFESTVLRCIVEYFCTGKVKLLDTYANEKSVKLIGSLVKAADFFFVPSLCETVQNWAVKSIEKHPLLVWPIMEISSSPNSQFLSAQVLSRALSLVRTQLSSLLDEGVVQNLSSFVIESALEDKHMHADEKTKFLLLQTWAKGGVGNKRRKVAQRLSGHLSLFSVSTSDLSLIVAPSGLVPETKLLEAYKKQALVAEQEYAVNFGAPAWESSKVPQYICESSKHSVEKLDCVPLESGIHSWQIKIERECSNVWLGVVSSTHSIDQSDWLGKQSGGWVYGTNGAACHATHQDNGPYNRIHPKMSQGDVITLTLDLTGDGTLSAKVNRGNRFKIFSNMFAAFGEKQDAASFVPAVSLKKPGKVVLLDMNSKYNVAL